MAKNGPREVRAPPYLVGRETVNLAQAVAWARFRENPKLSLGGMTVELLRSTIRSMLPNDPAKEWQPPEETEGFLPDVSIRPSGTLLESLEDGSAEGVRKLLTPWRGPDRYDMARDEPDFTWTPGHLWLTKLLKSLMDQDDEARQAMLRERLDLYLNREDAVRPPANGCVWVGEIEASTARPSHERWKIMTFEPPPGSAQSWGLEFPGPGYVYDEFYHRQVSRRMGSWDETFDRSVSSWAPSRKTAQPVGAIERLAHMLFAPERSTRSLPRPGSIRSLTIRYRLYLPRDGGPPGFLAASGPLATGKPRYFDEISVEDLLREFPPVETRGNRTKYGLFKAWLEIGFSGGNARDAAAQFEEFLATMTFQEDENSAAELADLTPKMPTIKKELAKL